MKLWLSAAYLLLLLSCSSKESEPIATATDQTVTDNMDLHYAYTILYVPNVPETIAFYQKAFGFEQKFLTPEL
ncbi:MAG: hypothetical protein AAFN81_33010, partial [Bacteroidota bacterium]